MKLSELYTELTLKDSGFKRGLSEANRQIKETAASLNSFANRGLIAFAALVGGAAGVLKLASDAEEIGSKFDAVFKEEGAAAEKWAQDFAKAANRSIYDLKAFLSSVQDTFVPLGFARDTARDMSQQVTQLAVDLASFNNAAEPEVVQLLTSALVGNHEAVRRFGIVITEATLKEELLRMGIEGGAKAATNQQKVMARLNLIMKSTTDAQGDAIRTSGSFANQMRGLKAALKEAGVELGNALLPLVSDLVKFVSDIVPKVVDWIKENKELIEQFGKIALAAGAFFVTLKLLAAAMTLYGMIQAATVAGPAGLIAFGAALVGATYAAEQTYHALDKLGSKYKSVGEAARGAADKVTRHIKRMLEAAKKAEGEGFGTKKREPFLPPGKLQEQRPWKPRDIQDFRTQITSISEKPNKQASFVGAVELFKRMQTSALNKMSEDRERKKLELQKKNVELLEQINDRLGSTGGMGVAITSPA